MRSAARKAAKEAVHAAAATPPEKATRTEADSCRRGTQTKLLVQKVPFARSKLSMALRPPLKKRRIVEKTADPRLGYMSTTGTEAGTNIDVAPDAPYSKQCRSWRRRRRRRWGWREIHEFTSEARAQAEPCDQQSCVLATQRQIYRRMFGEQVGRVL